MSTPESLKWAIERANLRLAQMKDDPNNPTLKLTDAADLDRAILKLRHRLDPKNVVLPPEKPARVRFVVPERCEAKVVTQNDWKRIAALIERHIKHLEEKKYENIMTWDYAVPPKEKDKPAEIKKIEQSIADGRIEVLQACLQSRDSTYIIPWGFFVATYVPSTGEYWELKFKIGTREMGIESLMKSLTLCKAYRITPFEEKAK